MSDLLGNFTDDEVEKYNAAARIKQAGLDAKTLKNKKSVFNPETGTHDILTQMSSGGYVKIGEETLDVTITRPGSILLNGKEYGRETPEYQRYYPDPEPQPEVMTTSPSMGELGQTEEAPFVSQQTRIEGAQEYADFLNTRGMATPQELLAAGYSPEVTAAVFGNEAQDNMPNQVTRTEPLSTTEVEDIIRNGGSVIGEYDPTLRETGRRELSEYLLGLAEQSFAEDLRNELLERGSIETDGRLIQPLSTEQIDNYVQRQLEAARPRLKNESSVLSDMFFGSPNSLGIGVGDFVTAGIMDIQEGARLFSQGRNNDSVADRGLGALLVIAGLAEATGVGKLISKPLKKVIQKTRAGLADAGQAADLRIAEEGNTLYSNPITPVTNRMISMISKLVREPEKNIINTAFPDQQSSEAVQAQVATQKNNYPAKDGWLQEGMEVASVKQKKDKVEVTYKEVPYNFHIPPENVDPTKWQNTIKRKTVNEIKKLADRAAQGDPGAKAIIEQANWYRAMRARMRQEFGGLGDLFADLLGTTSAQTGVTQNFDNAVEIMRRFSRGEFDNEIRMYEEMLAKGDTSPIKLGQMHNDPNSPFKLITKASGSLFNANSPASTRALLDLFRSAKGSPKTPNFTGNLIGYTNAATVDVWAARFLRRMSGQKRLPPPVEKGVSGKHMVGSTLAEPKIGAEFGFGQRVIQDAVDEINKKGFIKNVAPNIGEMGADDLQAVLWFLEKERWTKKGWTSKAGEGGSLDYEASLAGAADQGKIKTNREIVNKKFTPPKKRKKETDEQYAARVKQAQEADATAKLAAQEEIDAAAAPVARYVLGISVERPGARPTNVEQANVAARLGEPAKQDQSVVMYQVNNTYGRFMQSDERAFNAEFVVRENFDPSGVTRRMVEVAKDADQDAAFISKIVPERTADSRPGVEIYFRNRQDADYARDLSDELTKYNVDGFTFITDARVADQPGRQAGMNEEAIAGLTGIRFQYIPEFDMGADAWNAMSAAEKAAKLDEIEVIYANIILDLNRQNTDISTAIITHNETNVIGKDGYDAILGTTSK